MVSESGSESNGQKKSCDFFHEKEEVEFISKIVDIKNWVMEVFQECLQCFPFVFLNLCSVGACMLPACHLRPL